MQSKRVCKNGANSSLSIGPDLKSIPYYQPDLKRHQIVQIQRYLYIRYLHTKAHQIVGHEKRQQYTNAYKPPNQNEKVHHFRSLTVLEYKMILRWKNNSDLFLKIDSHADSFMFCSSLDIQRLAETYWFAGPVCRRHAAVLLWPCDTACCRTVGQSGDPKGRAGRREEVAFARWFHSVKYVQGQGPRMSHHSRPSSFFLWNFAEIQSRVINVLERAAFRKMTKQCSCSDNGRWQWSWKIVVVGVFSRLPVSSRCSAPTALHSTASCASVSPRTGMRFESVICHIRVFGLIRCMEKNMLELYLF